MWLFSYWHNTTQCMDAKTFNQLTPPKDLCHGHCIYHRFISSTLKDLHCSLYDALFVLAWHLLFQEHSLMLWNPNFQPFNTIQRTGPWAIIFITLLQHRPCKTIDIPYLACLYWHYIFSMNNTTWVTPCNGNKLKCITTSLQCLSSGIGDHNY